MYTVRPRSGLRPQSRHGPRETVNRPIPLRGFPPIIAAAAPDTNAIPHVHPFYRGNQVSYRTAGLPDDAADGMPKPSAAGRRHVLGPHGGASLGHATHPLSLDKTLS